MVRGQAKVESSGLDLDLDLDLDLELVRPELGRVEAVRAGRSGEMFN